MAKKKVKVITIKKAGWFYILICILLGVGAINTGNNLVYMIVSLLLGFMGVSGFYGARNLKNIQLNMYSPDEVYANRQTAVRVEVKNKRTYLPGFLLKVSIGDEHSLLPFVPCGKSLICNISMKFTERGKPVIGDVYISSVFPFNFFTRYRYMDVSPQIIVYPEPKYCELYTNEGDGKKKGDSFADIVGYEDDLISIRDYAEGDPLKYIHWKASAKTGELKVKELSQSVEPPVIVDLNRMRGDDIEQKLSCATFVITGMHSRGIAVGLRYEGIEHTPAHSSAHKRKLLKELALYGKSN